MKYAVDLQNEEINELANYYSITGTVNGAPTACLCRFSSLKGLSKAEMKAFKQKALIEAYLYRQGQPPKTGADEVEYEPTP